MLQQNRTEKVGGKEKEERRYDQVQLQWRNTSGGATSRSIATMQQFCRLIKWWEQRWRRRWWYYLQNFQDSLDRTDGEMWRLGSVRYMRWIYLPKVLWQERNFMPKVLWQERNFMPKVLWQERNFMPKVLWQERNFRRWWFFVVFVFDHINIIINFRFPFNCPLGHLIMRSGVFNFHWITPNFYTLSENFYCAYLLQIDQAQLKNSNYDALLSISMEICSKGIFISIWNLYIQIKVHKENIRKKRYAHALTTAMNESMSPE